MSMTSRFRRRYSLTLIVALAGFAASAEFKR
jgi:hypothetical protein